MRATQDNPPLPTTLKDFVRSLLKWWAGGNVKNNQSAMVQSNTIKPIRMEDFIKRVNEQ